MLSAKASCPPRKIPDTKTLVQCTRIIWNAPPDAPGKRLQGYLARHSGHARNTKLSECSVEAGAKTSSQLVAIQRTRSIMSSGFARHGASLLHTGKADEATQAHCDSSRTPPPGTGRVTEWRGETKRSAGQNKAEGHFPLHDQRSGTCPSAKLQPTHQAAWSPLHLDTRQHSHNRVTIAGRE